VLGHCLSYHSRDKKLELKLPGTGSVSNRVNGKAASSFRIVLPVRSNSVNVSTISLPDNWDFSSS